MAKSTNRRQRTSRATDKPNPSTSGKSVPRVTKGTAADFSINGWAARAEALGWGPLDMFGCDRERPLGRTDHAGGLLWLLKGGNLVELAANMAALETPTGCRQLMR